MMPKLNHVNLHLPLAPETSSFARTRYVMADSNCKVILHVWETGKKLAPSKYEYTFPEIAEKKSLLNLIETHLGKYFKDQMLSLVTGRATTLLEMPEDFLAFICDYLTVKDVLNLSSTCRFMFEFYSSDFVWESIFEKCFRDFCTYFDYEEGQKLGGFKGICKRVYEKNADHPIIRGFFGCNILTVQVPPDIDCLIPDGNAPTQQESAFYIDESLENFYGHSSKQTTSRMDLSEKKIKTEIYTASSSNATTFLYHNYNNSDGGFNFKEKLPGYEKGYERPFYMGDLKKRIKKLEKLEKNHKCGDECVVGDKSAKYALKYREN